MHTIHRIAIVAVALIVAAVLQWRIRREHWESYNSHGSDPWYL